MPGVGVAEAVGEAGKGMGVEIAVGVGEGSACGGVVCPLHASKTSKDAKNHPRTTTFLCCSRLSMKILCYRQVNAVGTVEKHRDDDQRVPEDKGDSANHGHKCIAMQPPGTTGPQRKVYVCASGFSLYNFLVGSTRSPRFPLRYIFRSSRNSIVLLKPAYQGSTPRRGGFKTRPYGALSSEVPGAAIQAAQ